MFELLSGDEEPNFRQTNLVSHALHSKNFLLLILCTSCRYLADSYDIIVDILLILFVRNDDTIIQMRSKLNRRMEILDENNITKQSLWT